jgi:hypothetical protein
MLSWFIFVFVSENKINIPEYTSLVRNFDMDLAIKKDHVA